MAGKKIGSFWNKARETTKADGGDAVPVEVGTYDMQVVYVAVGDFGNSRKVHLKFAVVTDGEQRGQVCNFWEGVDDEERMVWLQRLLANMGVDLDECEIETEDDLVDIFEGMIEDMVCVKVQVTEKDGWRNMRIKKVVEIDEVDLFDPEDALNGGEADEGDEPEDEESDGEEESEDEESEGEESEYEYSEGDRLVVDYDGDELEATVIGAGTDSVEVQYDVDETTEVVTADSIVRRLDGDEESDGEEESEDEESEGDEEPDELAKGDRVVVTVSNKERAGEVVSTNASKGTCRIRLDYNGKTTEFQQDEVDFEVE